MFSSCFSPVDGECGRVDFVVGDFGRIHFAVVDFGRVDFAVVEFGRGFLEEGGLGGRVPEDERLCSTRRSVFRNHLQNQGLFSH